jgi:hypothetical protein
MQPRGLGFYIGRPGDVLDHGFRVGRFVVGFPPGAAKRAAGEALIREADDLLCQSWNERMWAAGGSIDPSPTIDHAINGGYSWLEVRCSRCRTPRSVDLARLRNVETTCVHDLARRLRCAKCREAGKRPAAELLQLGKVQRNFGDGR